ncbi:hypothetical protein TW74_14100 [Vibrio nigripulchritudo]|nr:hypothetical protein TW74_14100 [Vibrio nigripulchritudo]
MKNKKHRQKDREPLLTRIRRFQNSSRSIISWKTKDSEFVYGRWQFWLLHTLVIFGFWFGVTSKGFFVGFETAFVIYSLPFIIGRGQFSEKVSYFYKFKTYKSDDTSKKWILPPQANARESYQRKMKREQTRIRKQRNRDF